MIISLEGLPGSGKTTSANLLAKRLGTRVLYETTRDHPFLQTVYDDVERYDLQVELAFLLLHHAAYRRLPQEEMVVTDFSPVKDLLFAEAILAEADLELFEAVYTHLYARHPRPHVVLVLGASPELCLQRIRRRLRTDPHRSFEEGLDLKRLEMIQAAYANRHDDLGERVFNIAIGEHDSEENVTDRIAALLESAVGGRGR
jgi:deoxyadenosine/deoxycytidine kinase